MTRPRPHAPIRAPGAAAGPAGPMRVPVREECDVVVARGRAGALARRLGFSAAEVGAVVTAVSEIARNVVVHARAGEVLLAVVEAGGRRGLEVVVRDGWPGIADVAAALRDGYSTGTGLGLGLPGARRLMDELEVSSAPGHGTTVVMRKWERARRRGE